MWNKMSEQWYLVVLSQFCLFSIMDANVIAPHFIRPCEDSSGECLKYAMQTALPGFVRGIPELGIISLDPHIIHDLKLVLPGDLKIHIIEGVNRGFRKCIVNYASLDKNELQFSVRCNVTIKGKYQSTGKLLFFSIDGDGDAMIKCRDLTMTIKLTLETRQKNDKLKYLHIKQYKAGHSYEGQIVYRMTNIIKNNPEISEAVVDFMNANWKMVAEEFGDPIIDFGVRAIVDNIRKLFEHIPADRLFKFPLDF